jgi:hypothetical protein
VTRFLALRIAVVHHQYPETRAFTISVTPPLPVETEVYVCKPVHSISTALFAARDAAPTTTAKQELEGGACPIFNLQCTVGSFMASFAHTLEMSAVTTPTVTKIKSASTTITPRRPVVLRLLPLRRNQTTQL